MNLQDITQDISPDFEPCTMYIALQELTETIAMMENPGIPLVKANGQYSRYVSTEQLIHESSIMSSSSKFEEVKSNLGFRLRTRKELIGKRTSVVNVSFLLSIIGIALAVLDTELQFAGVVTQDEAISIIIRAVVSVTTLALIASVLAYNAIGLKLDLISAGLDNWRLVVNYRVILKTLAEVVVCSFHPLPFGSGKIPMAVVRTDDNSEVVYGFEMVPANCILAILMFLRLYILMRFLVVHSSLFRDTTVQSLGALSKVNINAQFVFKAMMTTKPILCLTSILVTCLFIDSWSLRLCEYYANPTGGKDYYAQALWLTTVTFLTLGYGDVVPTTVCGRVIAIQTGMMGVGIMALCVAVLARKLEQTRAEKYVHTFVQQICLDKIRRHSAADVVKQSFRVWQLRRRGFSKDDRCVLKHRRKLLDSIRTMNESQFTKSALQDFTVGTVEVSKGVNEVSKIASDIKEDQDTIHTRLDALEKLVTNIHFQLHEIKECFKDKAKDNNENKAESSSVRV